MKIIPDSPNGKMAKAYFQYTNSSVSARIELYDATGNLLEAIPIPTQEAPTLNDRYNAVQRLNEIIDKKIQDRK